ncbi:P-II family nitrogen regulator [Candidatus Sulfurimonas marisnigri]|uniref:P-II family nitrogen regulator n=1 Tax=Candidatus Sulfurimonas marisnigri TaxID=2740405 RepID=A0A7S7RPW3_9BACT|nr:P-II family nitrogen regulator [Candidatus Sulfurimonas marisnigri]QOY53820.1 P-II family nitrogen regulator [Candidatus Sulfurimonas marisnigri]
MYMVTAVINQDDLKSVLEDLFSNDIEGITVSYVIGKGSFGLKEADNIPTDLLAKVKLEIVISDTNHREIAMECIRSNSQDLGRGAGKMWWVEVGGVERIRTGEKDVDALTTQVNKKIKNVQCGLTTNIDTPCS